MTNSSSRATTRPTNGVTTFTSNCFGQVNLTPALEKFRHVLNREIIELLHSLPASMHADAVIFFLEHRGTSFIPQFDFFRHYHAPSWTTLYWIAKHDRSGRLTPRECRWAQTAHAMALFLHPLDDHLNDGQLPPSHLSLLLRSQAWLRMQQALEPLAARVKHGDGLVRNFLDDYYASIATPPPAATLDGYCDHFRKQMATWLIVPVLMARRQTADPGFATTLQLAYEAFGIAWRLLDDLQDIEPDRCSATPSAIYHTLPGRLRSQWRREGTAAERSPANEIDAYLATHDVQDTIRDRIDRELALAADSFTDLGLVGLAAELQALARPFQRRGGQ